MGGSISYRSRFPLPDNWDVDEFICAIVPIPNDPQYISAFRGLLDTLTWSRSFELHPTEQAARQVADTWAEALASQELTFMDCEGNMFNVRQSDDDPCKLEKTTDGETWVEWADLQACPPIVQVDPATGKTQWWNPRATGGPKWEPIDTTFIPGGAPPPTRAPYPPGTDKYIDDTARCASAANIVAQLMNGTVALCADARIVSGSALLLVLALAALLLFIPGGVLVDIALGIVGIAIGHTVEEFTDASGEIDWPDLRDQLACYLARDGSITSADLAAFVAWMGTQYSGNLAWQVAVFIMSSESAAGITASGGVPQNAIDIDCAVDYCAFDWEHTFDFTAGMDGWVFTDLCGGHPLGVRTSDGLQTVHDTADCVHTYTYLIAHIDTTADIVYARVDGLNGGNDDMRIQLSYDLSGGRGTVSYLYHAPAGVGAFHFSQSTTVTIHGAELYIDWNSTYADMSNTAYIGQLTLRGTGTDPF